MSTLSSFQLEERLRAWARGSLPCMAAVEFLVGTGTDLSAMVVDNGDRAYLDLFELDDERWSERVGWMSSGQRATWELARSIVDGELCEWYWRLDHTRRAALIRALTTAV